MSSTFRMTTFFFGSQRGGSSEIKFRPTPGLLLFHLIHLCIRRSLALMLSILLYRGQVCEARGCALINTDMLDQQSPCCFFSLLYRCQNSLNKGKQITPQVGMFTVQVASGQGQTEQKYLYPQDHPGKPLAQIKYYQQLKELKAGLCMFLRHILRKTNNFLWVYFGFGSLCWTKVHFLSSSICDRQSQPHILTRQLIKKQTGWCVGGAGYSLEWAPLHG